MMLPNAEKAVVAEAKVVDYLLNPAHLDGATKARFFVALGFCRDEWEILAGRLRLFAVFDQLLEIFQILVMATEGAEMQAGFDIGE